jgi:hypothetical protein
VKWSVALGSPSALSWRCGGRLGCGCWRVGREDVEEGGAVGVAELVQVSEPLAEGVVGLLEGLAGSVFDE